MNSTALTITWILIGFFGLGMFAMMARLWYFNILLLNNRLLGKKPSGFFDASCYNPVGQDAHRRMLRFYWKTIACGLGGMFLIVAFSALLNRWVS